MSASARIFDPVRRDVILRAVAGERLRQEQRKMDGRFTHTCADDGMTDYEKLAVLVEEVGEVAREALTMEGRRLARDTLGTRDSLRAELIQVAAVAVAWAESLLPSDTLSLGAPLELWINRGRFAGERVKPTMTGRELRELPFPSIPDDADLFQVIPGDNDRLIGDDDRIDVSHCGARFFSAPKHINAGALPEPQEGSGTEGQAVNAE